MAAGCSVARTIKRFAPGKLADGAALGGINTPAAVNALALVSEGAQLAAGGADNLIRVWDVGSRDGTTGVRRDACRNSRRSRTADYFAGQCVRACRRRAVGKRRWLSAVVEPGRRQGAAQVRSWQRRYGRGRAARRLHVSLRRAPMAWPSYGTRRTARCWPRCAATLAIAVAGGDGRTHDRRPPARRGLSDRGRSERRKRPPPPRPKE